MTVRLELAPEDSSGPCEVCRAPAQAAAVLVTVGRDRWRLCAVCGLRYSAGLVQLFEQSARHTRAAQPWADDRQVLNFATNAVLGVMYGLANEPDEERRAQLWERQLEELATARTGSVT